MAIRCSAWSLIGAAGEFGLHRGHALGRAVEFRLPVAAAGVVLVHRLAKLGHFRLPVEHLLAERADGGAVLGPGLLEHLFALPHLFALGHQCLPRLLGEFVQLFQMAAEHVAGGIELFKRGFGALFDVGRLAAKLGHLPRDLGLERLRFVPRRQVLLAEIRLVRFPRLPGFEERLPLGGDGGVDLLDALDLLLQRGFSRRRGRRPVVPVRRGRPRPRAVRRRLRSPLCSAIRRCCSCAARR